MSSNIESLFGDIDGGKIEKNVNKLFTASSGPVDKSIINARKRTVLPELAKPEESVGQSTKEDLEEKPEEKPEENPHEESDDSSEQPQEEEEEEYRKSHQKKHKKNDDNDGLEERYFAKLMDRNEEPVKEKVTSPEPIENGTKGSSAQKLDLREEEFEKAERTIFVGSVPADVISNKSLYTQFKKLFQDEKGIESIRFRSISFETPLPRKVAFVQQKLHKSRASVNAYVVLKNKDSILSMCSRLNGHFFAGRHLRVDSVTHPAKHDNKRSIFVGNLNFEEDEENLWRHFSSCGEIEYVRIIRDSKTNMGKGFAYVQFKDFSHVNKALLLDGKQLESVNGKKRSLRVSRSKNLKKSSPFKHEDRVFDKLSETHKTKLGRAKKVLNKADAARLGEKITVEGIRASRADSGSSSQILGKRKKRSKVGRVTKRSLAHKKKNK